MAIQTRFSNSSMMKLDEKIKRFSWPLFISVCIVLVVSLVMLYSAGGGSWRPYALSQLNKMVLAFGVFFIAAFINIKTWIKFSYLIYAGALAMIVMVTFFGHTGMGAQRWLDLGFVFIQPSEFIKIALVISLARYFSWMNSVEVKNMNNYLIPVCLFSVPFLFIVAQPDLGTALSLAMIAGGMFFVAGAPRKWFITASIVGVLSLPVVWYGGMHDYQRQRVITFMNPEQDVLGAGYQITQAKIAFGSGGLVGNGYMSGTQSQQQFLPEKQTDFIFTMLGEEFGFIGAFTLISAYITIIFLLLSISKKSKNRFGQLLCFGFMLNFFIYYFINIAMVLGLMPTVGVPLPLVSFGGSSLLSLMFGLGLCQNAYINKDQQLSGKGA